MSEKAAKPAENQPKADTGKPLRIITHIKAGPNRRPHDHIGNFQF